MKAVIPALTFATRHFLIVAFAIIAGFILWSIAYLLLLVIAVIGNQGLGGPLAYPAGVIAIVGACIVLGWGVFTPASGIGAIFCWVFQLPRLAVIPVVFGSAFLLSYLLYWGYTGLITTHSMPSVWIVAKNFTIFLSVPLGAYWWLTEGPGAIFDAFRRWFRSRRRRNTTNSEQGEDNQAAAALESKP
jgi:hypothetical protein